MSFSITSGSPSRLLPALAAVSLIWGCSPESDAPASQGALVSSPSVAQSLDSGSSSSELVIGIDLAGMDEEVSPNDDFYTYANGGWMQDTAIPADKTRYGNFNILGDTSQQALRGIIEAAAAAEGKIEGTDAQKVGDFYTSFMNTALANDLGIQPIEKQLEAIGNVNNKMDVIKTFAEFGRQGLQRPLSFFVNNDLKQTDQYAIYLNQSGLGLPDRDDYFAEDERSQKIRASYESYVESLFRLAGFEDAAQRAETVLIIEAALAEHHWTRVQNRDRNRTYNRLSAQELSKRLGGFDWAVFAEGLGLKNEGHVIVRQPSYLEGFATVFADVDVDQWQDYLRYKLISGYAPYLSQPFVDAEFEFYRRALRGAQEPQPRWKRAVDNIDNMIGELVGKVYVAEYFPPAAKARMDELVKNLRAAMRESILEAKWMDEATQAEALTKLEKFTAKIGYPDQWIDYSKLEISPADLVGNVRRAQEFEFERNRAKLGGPIQRHEWFMTPQTVNAYYNPAMNEIVFPAAIMQPPFFDLNADDAANYGAIGTVIGHELGHGFDDQGRKTDGDGELRDWWTEASASEYKNRADQLVKQYGGYEPIKGLPLNGQLTLGENIGDLGGVSIAYRAYQKSLNGEKSPVMEGLTGEQRFFIAFAQAFRGKYREDELARRIKTDPHSPVRYRVNGVVPNVDAFYEAFGVSPANAMYMAPEDRVTIW